MMKTVLAILISVCCCGVARGQTADAVPTDWPDAIQSLAEALVANDADALSRLMSDSVTLRPLGDLPDDGEPLPLMRGARGAEILMARAYVQPPLALASDIADEVSGSDAVSEPVRERLWVSGETAKRANATAAQWVGELLGARQGDLVGVVLLWKAESSKPVEREGTTATLMFVLVKAQQKNGGPFKITSIVFGTPPELTQN